MIGAAWTAFSAFFGGKLGGMIAGGLIVVVLGLGVAIGVQRLTIAGLQVDVADAERRVAEKKAELADMTANRDRLKDTVERQNASIAALQESARATTREANLRAAVALAGSRAAGERLRSGPAMNPEEINAWFRLHFE